MRVLEDDFAELVVPRFLRYVKIWTTSDRHVEETPSSPGQWELARLLVKELDGLGLKADLTDHCYVIARLPASPGLETKPVIGFLAHLDTAQDVSGKDVKPVLAEKYDGKKIVLGPGAAGAVDRPPAVNGTARGSANGETGNLDQADVVCLDPETDPGLAAHKGKAIIHTDGTTLLGADDKAGIAEIMGAAGYLLSHPEIKHGPVEIIFSPDEETGKGLPFFPMDKLASRACYTFDGGALGELEAECFNAWSAKVSFSGRVIHLGQARGTLVNACLMAASFAVMLPRSESPEATDGYYGYYCPTEIKGSLESAELEVYIRDFDLSRAKERVEALDIFAAAVEAQFPGGRVTVEAQIQYYNIKEKIDQNPEVLAKLEEAARRTGIAFTLKPIRGGTDGSKLTEMGIPTPNIFTGGRNFHSVTEWVSVQDMA
ncbi:MAG: tripeptide aminopeptidase PepT, partial [Treponema sp.]|nr:tripeptide aminopeptidase PepT [Treponema sp.]